MRKSEKKGKNPRKFRSNYKKSRSEPIESKFFSKEEIFLSRLASILRMSKGDVRGAFSQRSVTTIRINPLADNPEKIKAKFEDLNWKLKPVPWAENVYIVTDRDKSELGKTQEYKKGLFYIQNLSSMLPVVVLDPQPGEEVLDVCAAPGSKTSMMAAMMKNKGNIIANDEDFSRSQKLQSVLDEFYVKNTEVRIGDGAKIGTEYPNYFDKILLDAPCSGEGLVYLRKPKPLRFWNIKKINIMSKVQKKLITAAYDSLKPGGTLIYSTCTLEPDENEGVVTHLLERNPKAKVVDIDLISDPNFAGHLGFTRPGITHWSGKDYHESTKKALRVVPGKTMQAFFVAKIIKPKARVVK